MNAETLHDYFGEFLAWERSTRDVIDLKKTYIDVAGDIECGLMLSQIVYWHLPSRKGEGKLTIYRDNHWWLAKKRYDWWEETRLTPKQVDRCLKMLRNLGFIYTKVYRFAGDPIVHIRMDVPKFLAKFWEVVYDPPTNPFLPDGEKPISLNGKNEVDEKVITSLPFGQILYTETTAEITAKTGVVADATPQTPASAGVKRTRPEGRKQATVLDFPVKGLTAKVLTGETTNAIKDLMPTYHGVSKDDASWAKYAVLAKFLAGGEIQWPLKGKKDDVPPMVKPVTVEEFEKFTAWIHKSFSGNGYPSTPETLREWIGKYRAISATQSNNEGGAPAWMKPSEDYA
jgi:hypothetical protein